MTAPPLVGLPCDVKLIDDMPFHAVGEKYLTALTDAADCLPVTIPSLGSRIDLAEMLNRLDGLLLTGSPSNVEPHRYDGTPSKPGTEHDPERDATTFPIIELALAAGIPSLFICRGIQELNVVLGGSLHQRIQDLSGHQDHRASPDEPIDMRYGPAHDVTLTAAGQLIGMNDGTSQLTVNSLHSQGIDRLASGLVAEAVAPDGIIEAVRVEGSAAFAIGIQWHPEWKVTENAFSMRLFESFGAACQARRDSRIATTDGRGSLAAE